MVTRASVASMAGDLFFFGGQRFSLVHRFILFSLIAIAFVVAIFSWALSRQVTQKTLERDFTVSTEFVNSVVRLRNATSYFYGEVLSGSAPEVEQFFRDLAARPDVFRANVYGFDRTIIWSSDPDMIGRRFDGNTELEAAFRNDPNPKISLARNHDKEEHASLPENVSEFIEHYLPIWAGDASRVIGAVEVYRSPENLLRSIHDMRRLIWIGAAVASILLFAMLVLVVWYANRLLRVQERRLVEAERLAVVGEMTTAVAHGFRNPLASIRSCAELALEDDLTPDARRSITDIVSQSDRLESWIRGFLISARDQDGAPVCRLDDVVRESLGGFAAQLQGRNITCRFRDAGDSPLVGAAHAELGQVLNTLLSNSIEAIQQDGEIRIQREIGADGFVRLEVADTGPGLSSDAANHLFEPFATSKSSGVGVGLSLAHRFVERSGGTLEIVNSDAGGARALVRLPAYSEVL